VEDNKGIDNAVMKEIIIKERCTGQQALNRCFVDVHNIHKYPDVQPLVEALVQPPMTAWLENIFDVNLAGTALRVELLRNGPGHYLTPHCDCVEKILTLLIWVNDNEQPLNSGTDIYKPKHDGSASVSTLSRSVADFETVKEIPFVTGNCLIFHPAADTWHGLSPGKAFDDRRFLQINWVSKEYSVHPDCFKVLKS
jgi:hypothetical protein